MTDPRPRSTDPADPAYDDVRLSDGRVSLRPWRVADAALMAAACADPEIALFCMMPAGYTEAMANSGHPATAAFLKELQSICRTEPEFRNLDVHSVRAY
jgi:hypothetical protein